MTICTNGFLNCTDTIGIILGSTTQYTTGDLFMTFLIIMLVLCALCLMIGLRLEYSMIIILPLLLSYMGYYSAFDSIGIVILLYLSIVMTYNFIIR